MPGFANAFGQIVSSSSTRTGKLIITHSQERGVEREAWKMGEKAEKGQKAERSIS